MLNNDFAYLGKGVESGEHKIRVVVSIEVRLFVVENNQALAHREPMVRNETETCMKLLNSVVALNNAGGYTCS